MEVVGKKVVWKMLWRFKNRKNLKVIKFFIEKKYQRLSQYYLFAGTTPGGQHSGLTGMPPAGYCFAVILGDRFFDTNEQRSAERINSQCLQYE
jgi:hypothetical protein